MFRADTRADTCSGQVRRDLTASFRDLIKIQSSSTQEEEKMNEFVLNLALHDKRQRSDTHGQFPLLRTKLQIF